MKWKWSYVFNVDMIFLIILIIAVIYCFFTIRRKPGKFDFQGLGEDGWQVSDGTKYWSRGLSAYRKKNKSKKKKSRINKHEERCRQIFQTIYRQKFKSVRPKWLENPVTGRNLELDGYCPDIYTPIGKGLAFEYDGEQHAKYNKHFHRAGKDEFLYQVKKDSWKNLRCKQKRVMLVRIPHFVAYHDLERYIKMKLKKLQVMPSSSEYIPQRMGRSSPFATGGMYG